MGNRRIVCEFHNLVLRLWVVPNAANIPHREVTPDALSQTCQLFVASINQFSTKGDIEQFCQLAIVNMQPIAKILDFSSED